MHHCYHIHLVSPSPAVDGHVDTGCCKRRGHASENVIPRSRELAEASIAVQDLGESVRATNMSASVVILGQLDDLGDSLRMLSEKITSFFTNVDGDIDSYVPLPTSQAAN
jgi:hypothetical protein